MSRAFIKDESEDRPSEELPERPLSSDPNYVTPEGMAQLRAKVEQLAAEHARLKEAGQDFDRPRLAAVERDLRYYQARVDSAIVVEVSKEPPDEVHFGASVKAEDEEGNLHHFTIVGEDEADVAKNKVSWRSPLAKALIGARVGDTVTWNRPAGGVNLEVLHIEYPRVKR
ncbi:MAG TPA: GreA/GreB family elongation factor [Burkholderiales bacterium]|nr:GreA/GreB family elongation factor [Burkholderiales bacterium]